MQGATMESGLVSVCMPVFNREAMVEAAVRSILEQTYEHLELIVVDDGSSDRTVEVIRSINDDRLRLIESPRSGVVASRHTAWQQAAGEFTATMDSDDICVPDRLAQQVEVLRSGVDMCAGQIELFWHTPGDHRGRQPLRPEAQQDCVAELFRSNPVANNAILYVSEAFRRAGDFYRPEEVPSADYALWSRLLPRTDLTFVNLPTTLVHYRGHEQQITRPGMPLNKSAARNVRESLFGRLGFGPTHPAVQVHCDVFENKRQPVTADQHHTLREFYGLLAEAAASEPGFAPEAIERRSQLFLADVKRRIETDSAT